MAELTDAQLRALIDELIIQTEDYVQAIVDYKLGINEATINLMAGTTAVVFDVPYNVNEDWDFIRANASADGFSIGINITNKTNTGFSVTVSKACEFKYRTTYMRNWISDPIT